ncbi:MAG: DUF1080 domain-containing protein [Verrucomicrobia bacterium]|nr:DUF1080 domain-containing protein [Verrucomicrobiota bacterium]
MTTLTRLSHTLCTLFCALTAVSANEEAADWKPLFDGKTTAGWRGIKTAEFAAQGWVVENGVLHCLPKGGGGDIITVKKYDNFEFSWEWRIGRMGNSGVKYLILPERGAIGPEYQMLDDINHPEAKHGPKRMTAGVFDVLGAKGAAAKPVGEWNQSRIVLQGKHVEHWLNGAKVLEYELESDALKTAIAESKFNKTSFYGVKTAGHILLQDHGTETWFRNLKIRELPER